MPALQYGAHTVPPLSLRATAPFGLQMSDAQRRILAWPEQWVEHSLGDYGPAGAAAASVGPCVGPCAGEPLTGHGLRVAAAL